MSEDLRSELEKYLEALNIQTRCVEHPPVKPDTPVIRPLLMRPMIPLFLKQNPVNRVHGSARLGSVCAVLTVTFEVLGRPARESQLRILVRPSRPGSVFMIETVWEGTGFLRDSLKPDPAPVRGSLLVCSRAS